jgi:hypothetical protein
MNTTTDASNLNITSNQYVAFDALSLRDFIISRLNTEGLFTDQNFQGSNITAVNNIISYAFHTLMYYMNQTSTETMFTEAQLYENINRIVNVINYSPIGAQTSTLSFDVSATANLAVGTYTIPRYTFLRLGNASYSFNSDVTFTKTISGIQELGDVANQYLLYQGSYIEYPLYTAAGESNEILYLVPGTNVTIDHFNIDVYVKQATTGKWTQWNKTESLYLQNATDSSYEIRLNSDLHYEIKFGDGINGIQLGAGDQVAVYYLQTAGTAGQVGVGALNGQIPAIYNTAQFNSISPDVISSDLTLLNDANIISLQFSNNTISTTFTDVETVASIRKNAPASFRSQFRVVTPGDYEAYVTNNFANIINSVAVLNNNQYVSQHLQYLYNIGLTSPGTDYRVLYNQMAFADAVNFNNVYVYVMPKATALLSNSTVNYLTPAQKQLINSSLNNVKGLTTEVIVMDPVYLAITIGLGSPSGVVYSDIANSNLVINMASNSKVAASTVLSNVQTILENYFNPSNITLGYTVDIPDLTGQILAIPGVQSIATQNTSSGDQINGVSLIVFNPSYPYNDIRSTTHTFTTLDFQTVYLNNINDILSRVVVNVGVTQSTSIVNF